MAEAVESDSDVGNRPVFIGYDIEPETKLSVYEDELLLYDHVTAHSDAAASGESGKQTVSPWWLAAE